MRYYITLSEALLKTSNNDYRIIKVQRADEAGFLEDYGHLVLASGSSLMEALLRFEQWKTTQQEGH